MEIEKDIGDTLQHGVNINMEDVLQYGDKVVNTLVYKIAMDHDEVAVLYNELVMGIYESEEVSLDSVRKSMMELNRAVISKALAVNGITLNENHIVTDSDRGACLRFLCIADDVLENDSMEAVGNIITSDADNFDKFNSICRGFYGMNFNANLVSDVSDAFFERLHKQLVPIEVVDDMDEEVEKKRMEALQYLFAIKKDVKLFSYISHCEELVVNDRCLHLIGDDLDKLILICVIFGLTNNDSLDTIASTVSDLKYDVMEKDLSNDDLEKIKNMIDTVKA